MTKFVHLHVHTHYSLLDGMCKIPELLDKAKELGMDSLAITDHGVMYGAIEFYKEAKKRDINPIIGFEGYISPRKMTDKEPGKDNKPHHIILLAKDHTGYLNLVQLTTRAHLEGYYYKPRFDKDLLKKHSKGLIGLSGCMQGEIAKGILGDDMEAAKRAALEYQEIFGEGNFYLEMQYTHDAYPEQEEINGGLKEISKDTGIPLVVSNDVHYINEDDREAQDVLLCLQTGMLLEEKDRMKMEGNNSLIPPQVMAELFKDTPEALENTVKIAKMCNLELELGKILIPKFETPKGYTEKSYLEKLVHDGLKIKYNDVTKEIKKRTEYELSVIEKMGYEGYFLIVWEFVNWAKDQGIVVGPGRGSAAGSVVSYILNITEVDPLKYDLYFERFLNPDRISMPDIDMDFADDRRGEVIQHVTDKYGKDRVAQIITFGTMKARNAIRDTGRVMGFPYTEVDRIAKMVPEILNIKLIDAVKMSVELGSEYNTSSEIKRLLDIAMKLEGVSRHASTHAAGVIIAKDTITNYAPLQTATKGELAINTQYSMNPLEDLGLLKFDFLGLANLTIIKNTLRIIKKVFNEDIDIEKLPLDDKKTFNLLGRGDTTGVFQFESSGMKKYLRELGPTVFEDAIAMVALYRPGPMQFIPKFLDRKHGRDKISYDHPLMEKALENTYGIVIYQEQVLRIAKDMAGFTGGEADSLRKAIGKKIAKLMKSMRNKFIEGCIKNGVDKKIATKVFDDFEAFAEYAFPKAHATCYALIAYQTAYLKAHYPDAFMAALMTSDYGDIDRIAIEIDECRRAGIEVLPPDVNESFAEFSVIKDENKIRFGMMAIKNVGMGIIKAIEKAREDGGPFKNITDFAKRVEAKEINKKVIESLAKGGAFDSIGERDDILHNLEKILGYASKVHKELQLGQTDLFGGEGINFPEIHLEKAPKKLSKKEKLDWEKELLGVYITDHPLKEYAKLLDKEGVIKIGDLKEYEGKKEAKIGGVITVVHKIYTKNKEPMMFVRMEDMVSSIELVVFPKILQKYPTRFCEGNVIIAKGKVNTKDGDPKVLVESTRLLSDNDIKEVNTSEAKEVVEIVKRGEKVLEIEIPELASKDSLQGLKKLLLENKGELETFIYIHDGEDIKKIKLPFGVKYTDSLKTEVEKLFKKVGA